jgi:tetratricopeptide (TPR) repeat protein
MEIKSCKLIFACFVASCILAFTLPGFAQNSSLQVKCVDSSGGPAQNVKVAIFNLNTQKDKEKKSDAQGSVEFTKLDDGIYRVVGRKDGFAPALFEFASLKGSRESVTLALAAGADKKLYFEDPAEGQKAMALLQQGLAAVKQNQSADGEKLFSQSLEVNPSNPAALYYLAVACVQQSKFDQAVEILNRAVPLANTMKGLPSSDPSLPNNEQVYQGAQQLLVKMPAIKGESSLNQKKYDEAAANFSEAIKVDPNNSELYYYQAVALTNAKKFDEAMAAIDKAIQLKPSEKAYADTKSSIAARKENAEIDKAQAVMNEGNKLLQDGDAAGAIKKFEEARSRIAPERQSPLWRQIAKAQAKLNQPDAAIASFKKSIELAPADKVAEYRNSFAQFYLENKNYDEALEVTVDPKAAGSKSPEQIMLDLAKTTKEPKIAEAALERAIKANPENPDAYYDLGQMYYADGKEMDKRTKELLTKYVEVGKDQAKLENAKSMLIIIARRNK